MVYHKYIPILSLLFCKQSTFVNCEVLFSNTFNLLMEGNSFSFDQTDYFTKCNFFSRAEKKIL